MSQSKATSQSDAMYTWWCVTQGHSAESLCKRHDLANKLRLAQPSERQALLAEMKAAVVKASSGSSASSFSAMKSAYCASPASRSLGAAPMVCDNPGSSFYKNRSFTSSDQSREEMMNWYCSKPTEVESAVCKRFSITSRLFPSRPDAPKATTEERRALLTQLRQIGAVPVGLTQAITSQFCRLQANVAKSVCLAQKSTAQTKEMQVWFCQKDPTDAWCKKQGVLDRLRATPVNSPARKEIAQELLQASKAPMKSVSATFTKAKAEFCALPGKASYALCRPASLARPASPARAPPLV